MYTECPESRLPDTVELFVCVLICSSWQHLALWTILQLVHVTLRCLVHVNVARSVGTVSASLVRVLLGHPASKSDAQHTEHTLHSEAGSCSLVLLKHILLTASSSRKTNNMSSCPRAAAAPTTLTAAVRGGHSSLHAPAALTPVQ